MKKILVLLVVAAAALPAAALATQRAAQETPQAGNRADARMTLTVRSTQFGRVLFDGRGRVLYGFTRDRRGGPSRCYGECAKAWPVYFSKGTMRAGAGVKQAEIGTTRRRDGRLQVTYNGWPLYYYAHEGPGEVLCHDVFLNGGYWWVVGPSGKRRA